MRMTRTTAKKYRRAMVESANTLTDEEDVSVPMLFERWEDGNHYEIGKRLYFGGKLYDVLQAHDSHEAYPPNITVSLYAEVLIPDPTVIPDWVQPGSTNTYMRGDKVRHYGRIWESQIDYNATEPGIVGTEMYWVEVQEN